MRGRKRENLVKVDFEKLSKLLKDRDATLTGAGKRIGVGNSYFSMAKNKYGGKVDEIRINLICDLYGIKKEDIVVKDEPEAKTEKPNSSPAISDEKFEEFANTLFKKLDKIAELLEKRETQRTVLSDQEDIVILLQQMLKHGACREDQFKEKAKQAGYGADLVNYAIEFMECKREVTGGKVWLKKK